MHKAPSSMWDFLKDWYSDRELIEMTAFFLGVKAGVYHEGKGLFIDASQPWLSTMHRRLKPSRLWNPLECDIDQDAILDEADEYYIDLSLPRCPESVNPDVYRRRMVCVLICDIVVEEQRKGELCFEWDGPFWYVDSNGVPKMKVTE
jgi:hypothetical protein